MGSKKSVFKDDYYLRQLDDSKQGNKWYMEIIYFIMVYSIAVFISSLAQIAVMIVCVFTNKDILNNIDNIEYVINALNKMLSLNVILLFLSNIVIIISVLFYCLKVEKRSFISMGLHKDNFIKEYILGYIAGIICITATLGICILTGSVEFNIAQKGSYVIILFFFGYLIQGFAEEVLCRSYLMVSIAKRNGIVAGIFINSIVFALLHLGNPGITWIAVLNLFLFGLLASMYMIKRRSIWAPAAFHSAWNFFQGNIFGIQVSGLDKQESLFSVEPLKGYKMINGGNFGVEGGIAVTIIFTVFIVVICLINYRKTVND